MTPKSNQHIGARRIVQAAAFALAFGTSFAAHAQVTEVTYATFLDPANQVDPRVAAQTKAIEAFEAANPDIKVNVLVDPTQQAALRALRSGGSSPDVFRATSFNMPEYIQTGNVLPLDEYIDRDDVSRDDWLLPLSGAEVRGHIYGLQQDYRLPILIYRPSLVEQAGIAELPKTWEDVCAMGEKAGNSNAILYPVGVGASGGIGGAQTLGENMFSSMVTETTGDYFDEDNKEFVAPKEQVIKTLTVIRDLFKDCGVTPLTSLQFGANEVHDGLRGGSIAMASYGLFRYRAIAAGGAGDDLGWAPSPSFTEDGKYAVYGFQVAINANSRVKDAAWELVKFLGSPEGQAITAEGGEVVARKSAYESAYFDQANAEIQKNLAQLVNDRGRLVNYSLATSSFHIALANAVQRMILQDASPEEAYDELMAEYAEALAQL